MNFIELQATVTIDMTQEFKVVGSEVKRNDAVEGETVIDIEYPLEACRCDLNDECRDNESITDTDSTNTINDEFLLQDEDMRVCVRFADDATDLPPAYVKISDVKNFQCTQGTLVHKPIDNYQRAGDGSTSVQITTAELNDDSNYDKDGRLLVITTAIPSAFFGVTTDVIDCTGTIVYEFTAGDTIPVPTRRILSEASLPVITGRELETNGASEFSVKVTLAAIKDATERNFALMFDLSTVGGAAVITCVIIVALIVALIVVVAPLRLRLGKVLKRDTGQDLDTSSDTSTGSLEVLNGAIA